ncbi:DUF3332 family protein [Psychromonas sp. RZ22]|uniref:DUF3332 family protein n=1 Tax=Psychromonas algarum TaxID=2555643 RepID=UPI0010681FB0|nr:DUF3332 family protein [Psychromonas sp. RZ22]TEW56199.1 DUF3332 family protein [Psychromonas sp. RZ22]
MNFTKKTALVLLFLGGVSSLSGCVGNNAVTEKVIQFNHEVVENHYARGGVNMLLMPVYGLTFTVDILVFNSIEFWSGKNPLNNQPYLLDVKEKKSEEKNNTTLQKTTLLLEEPVKPVLTSSLLQKLKMTDESIKSVQADIINTNTIEYHILYMDGKTSILRGEKSNQVAKFYLDGKFIARIAD